MSVTAEDLEEVGLDVRDQRRRAERFGQREIAALLQEAEVLIVEAMDLAEDDPSTPAPEGDTRSTPKETKP